MKRFSRNKCLLAATTTLVHLGESPRRDSEENEIKRAGKGRGGQLRYALYVHTLHHAGSTVFLIRDRYQRILVLRTSYRIGQR